MGRRRFHDGTSLAGPVSTVARTRIRVTSSAISEPLRIHVLTSRVLAVRLRTGIPLIVLIRLAFLSASCDSPQAHTRSTESSSGTPSQEMANGGQSTQSR